MLTSQLRHKCWRRTIGELPNYFLLRYFVLLGTVCLSRTALSNTPIFLDKPLSAVWTAPDANVYDLGLLFDDVIRIRLQDETAELVLAFGDSYRCGADTNPRHVSICVELIQAHTNDDHASLVLGRKNRISFTPIGDENPDGGFRLSFVANPNNFSRTPRAKTAITYVDLLCSRTLNDEEDDLLNIFTAATLSQTYPFALYKATVLGSVGCPISVDTDIDSETVEDGKVTYIDWTSASGQSVYRYSLYTLATIQTMIDVGKESKDVLEVSLGPQVMCGPENNDDVAICLHAENVIPTSVGFRSTRIVKRARATGVELQFTGSKCNDNQVFKTKLQVLCSDEEPIFHAVHVDECTIFIEARLADGCGEAIRRNTVLQGSRSPTQPRPPLPVPVTSPSEAPVEFIPRHWGPDVRHAGCVKGNCWAGEGMYVWRSGSTYEGQWLGGHRHGFGHHVWTDGRQYSGYWVDDKRSGIGNHTYATRDTYSGDWLDDSKHGQGVYTWHDGKTYKGEFAHDQMQGYGVKEWPDATKYRGMFRANRPHGNGVMSYPDGSKWSGTWVDGAPTEDGMILCQKEYVMVKDRCVKRSHTGDEL